MYLPFITLVITRFKITTVIILKKFITVVHILLYMGFWNKLDSYLKFRGIPRKELAIGIGMKPQTLDRNIERDSKVNYVDGLKICKYLNVSLDEFLDEPISLPEEAPQNNIKEIKTQINLYRKYSDLIRNCETMPEYQQVTVKNLAKSLAESSPDYSK